MMCNVESSVVSSGLLPRSDPSALQNQGDERASFVRTLLREQSRTRLSDTEAAWLSASV